MSELSELEGTDRLVYLLDKRLEQWETADARSRREHEAAEGFTRLWAELRASLRDGDRLPRIWAKARPVAEPAQEGVSLLEEMYGGHTVLIKKGEDETVVNWPDDARRLRDLDALRAENAELKAEVQRLQAELDAATGAKVLLAPSAHILEAMEASADEEEGTVIRATDDPAIQYELKAGTWVPRR